MHLNLGNFFFEYNTFIKMGSIIMLMFQVHATSVECTCIICTWHSGLKIREKCRSFPFFTKIPWNHTNSWILCVFTEFLRDHSVHSQVPRIPHDFCACWRDYFPIPSTVRWKCDANRSNCVVKNYNCSLWRY